MSLPIQITKDSSTLHSGGTVLGIDMNPFHARQVNHDTFVAERPPGYIVTATAHRDQQFIFACEVHSSHYIGYTCASCDDAWVLINAGIPDFPRFFIGKISRLDQLSAK